MKKLLCLGLCVLVFGVFAQAAEPRIVLKDGVVQIHGDDLDNTGDAVFEQSVKHPGVKIKVFVESMRQLSFRDVLIGDKQNMLSLGKDLDAGFFSAERRLRDEMERNSPIAAAKMKASPYDMRGNLTRVEQYLGLDKINPKSLSLIERCYRVCWVEGIYNRDRAKGTELKMEFK